MADIKQIRINGIDYNIKDETARNNFANYLPIAQKGAKNGVAELDENGLVPASQLPNLGGGGGTADIVSKAAAGLAPKLPANEENLYFLRGDAVWAQPVLEYNVEEDCLYLGNLSSNSNSGSSGSGSGGSSGVDEETVRNIVQQVIESYNLANEEYVNKTIDSSIRDAMAIETK